MPTTVTVDRGKLFEKAFFVGGGRPQKRSPKVPRSLVVPDEEGDGVVYVPPPKHELEAIQARMRVFEEGATQKQCFHCALTKLLFRSLVLSHSQEKMAAKEAAVNASSYEGEAVDACEDEARALLLFCCCGKLSGTSESRRGPMVALLDCPASGCSGSVLSLETWTRNVFLFCRVAGTQ